MNLSEKEPFRIKANLVYESNRNSIMDMRRDLYMAFGHTESCNMWIAAHVTDLAGYEA